MATVMSKEYFVFEIYTLLIIISIVSISVFFKVLLNIYPGNKVK